MKSWERGDMLWEKSERGWRVGSVQIHPEYMDMYGCGPPAYLDDICFIKTPKLPESNVPPSAKRYVAKDDPHKAIWAWNRSTIHYAVIQYNNERSREYSAYSVRMLVGLLGREMKAGVKMVYRLEIRHKQYKLSGKNTPKGQEIWVPIQG